MNKSGFIKNCRLCESNDLKKIINFGKTAIGNNLSHNRKLSLKSSTYPLELLRCEKCKHFQLSFEVAPSKLYATNYTYLSGIAPSFVKHFKEYSNWIIKKCKIKKNDLVLDIGSNDGTCLKPFKEKKINVLGIDPAKLPAQIANKNGIKTINNFFNKKNANKIKKTYGEIDFITSHNVLAHIGNIKDVFKNIYYLLKKDGYFCFEVGYFLKVLKNNYFDTIYHEHLDYHHARPITQYLSKLGFSIIHISENKIQGGSIRILCKKDGKNKILKQPKRFLLNEKKSVINNKLFLKNWQKKIFDNIKRLRKIILDDLKNNKKIIGYGAPTKAALLLKLAKLEHGSINYTIEDNSLKINKYIPETDVQIKPFKNIYSNKPNVMIVFAWNFASDIIKKLKKNKIKQLKIIVPLPKVKIINL
ncbi:class I SAM-dependent methyltransferase [Candidatus Pelagibacter bacterium nBUS_27]|uniref:class I SAM-dependent methyltransferase n=1 Tax=Candidatus Pelagibacter bacterium nBUS_27 TaxID=3374188 RepID=UPI003EB8AC9C